jgi:ferredoxin-NADP reductase
MSITRTLLECEPLTRIHLFYGNRGLEDIIFRDALCMLEQEYDDRLSVIHVLENPPEAWQGETGRLDRATFSRLLDGVLADNPLTELEVFTCGPEPVMKGVQDEVLARGLPAARFHQEKFTPAAGPADTAQFSAQPVRVRYNGQTWSATAAPGQTLAGGRVVRRRADAVFLHAGRLRPLPGPRDRRQRRHAGAELPDAGRKGAALCLVLHCTRLLACQL